MIIAVDFDGTISFGTWPNVGAPNMPLINLLREKQSKGARLILWTSRCGEYLERAVKYCEAVGLTFDAVNENLPDMKEKYGNDCRKVYADLYIDDASVKPSEYVVRFKKADNPYGVVGVF